MSTNISVGLLAALNASLADSGAGWAVTGSFASTDAKLSAVGVAGTIAAVSGTIAAVTGTIPAVVSGAAAAGSIGGGGGSVSGGGGTVASTNTTTTTVKTSVILEAANVFMNGSPRGLSFTYVSTWVNGAFSEGTVFLAQGQYRTTDSGLDTTIMALSAAFLAAIDAAAIAALS